MPVRGIRGATTVDQNTEAEIVSATQALLETILKENKINRDDIASIFFSVTQDLDAAFPASAARDIGLDQTPLLCLNEIPVPGSLPRCLRLLLHVNSNQPQSEMVHIYLKDAIQLRPELGVATSES